MGNHWLDKIEKDAEKQALDNCLKQRLKSALFLTNQEVDELWDFRECCIETIKVPYYFEWERSLDQGILVEYRAINVKDGSMIAEFRIRK